jgi:hypothetical protein
LQNAGKQFGVVNAIWAKHIAMTTDELYSRVKTFGRARLPRRCVDAVATRTTIECAARIGAVRLVHVGRARFTAIRIFSQLPTGINTASAIALITQTAYPPHDRARAIGRTSDPAQCD